MRTSVPAWASTGAQATQSPDLRAGGSSADRHSEGIGGREVDDQLELRRLLDRQVGRLGALEDPFDEAGRLAVEVQVVDAIGDEATGPEPPAPAQYSTDGR